MYPSVAVIVLNWNQADLTVGCLRSLLAADYPSDRLRVILVDNASQDDTVERVRREFPTVQLLVNAANLGFSEGNNVGIRHALLGAPDFVMLLNNDTVVAPDMISKLVEAAERDPHIGVVAPAIMYMDSPDVLWCTGATIDWARGTTKRINPDKPLAELALDSFPIDVAVGCAMCIRREAVEMVGMLDPLFFMYQEEADLCYRMTRAGWTIWCVPAAHMWHKVSASIGEGSWQHDYYVSRNMMFFISRNRHGFLPRTAALAGAVVTILRDTLRSTARRHSLRPNGLARLYALRDAALGRSGVVGPDVVARCGQV